MAFAKTEIKTTFDTAEKNDFLTASTALKTPKSDARLRFHI